MIRHFDDPEAVQQWVIRIRIIGREEVPKVGLQIVRAHRLAVPLILPVETVLVTVALPRLGEAGGLLGLHGDALELMRDGARRGDGGAGGRGR